MLSVRRTDTAHQQSKHVPGAARFQWQRFSDRFVFLRGSPLRIFYVTNTNFLRFLFLNFELSKKEMVQGANMCE
jgi:hypothetical protein